jgi:hypothetical protein
VASVRRQRACAVLAVALAALSLALAAGPGRAAPPARLTVVGAPQVVFDWSSEACSPNEEADLPARALRDASGQVELFLSHYVNYRLVGHSLRWLHPDCRPVMASPENGHPAAFADRQWIGSLSSRDGQTVWALVHDEYQGNRHPGHCPSGSYYGCWYNSITLARSRDGGRSFQPVPGRRLVAAPSFRFRPGVRPLGIFGPSNIVRGPDGALYSLLGVRDLSGRRGVCPVRTRTIGSAASWRASDGHGFSLRFGDPYRGAQRPRLPCRLVAAGRIAEMTESLTFNTVLDRYLLVGLAPPGPLSVGPKVWGIYYSTSTDLIHWTPRTLITRAVSKQSFRCGGPSPIAYPSLIDPHSRSRTFATSGAHPYLYYTQFNYRDCRQTEDRDLARMRLSISP